MGDKKRLHSMDIHLSQRLRIDFEASNTCFFSPPKKVQNLPMWPWDALGTSLHRVGFYTPEKSTWNLQTIQLKRQIIFQTWIFGFPAFPATNFPGCVSVSFCFSAGFGTEEKHFMLEVACWSRGVNIACSVNHGISTCIKLSNFART